MALIRYLSSFTVVAAQTYTKITGYEPGSDVSSHSRIDLDQKEFEKHLKTSDGAGGWTNVPDFVKAKDIYMKGGNSGAKAVITIPATAQEHAKGTAITQNSAAARADGVLKKTAPQGSTSIEVTYTSKCEEGGLEIKSVDGCFTTTKGNIKGGDGGVVDLGAATAVENKYRTLAGFSTAAGEKMAGQKYYAEYRAFWTEQAYAHNKVMGALEKTGACKTCDNVGREEIAKKSSSYMNVWMYVVREMEDAIMDCDSGCGQNCNDDPVHAWDEAVAFYSGSEEGVDGEGSGKLLYSLGEKRCANFGTCSDNDVYVNKLVMDQFTTGKEILNEGKCVELIPVKRRIVELMSVPLIQGALRYAYKVGQSTDLTTTVSSKMKAEGDVFASGVLPRVAVCDPDSANLIWTHLQYTAPVPPDFAKVKKAFEDTYVCMGITCELVNGLLKSNSQTEFEAGAEPCVTSELKGMPAPLTVPEPCSSVEVLTQAQESAPVVDDKGSGPTVAVIILGTIAVVASGAAAYLYVKRPQSTEATELAQQI